MTATGFASTCSASSRRSATTTPGCSRVARTSPAHCSEVRVPRSDLMLRLVLAAIGVGMLAWLGYDLADDDGVAPLQVVARLASALFWFGLAALAWSDRAKGAGLALSAGAVVVLLLTLTFGLLLVPDDFTN